MRNRHVRPNRPIRPRSPLPPFRPGSEPEPLRPEIDDRNASGRFGRKSEGTNISDARPDGGESSLSPPPCEPSPGRLSGEVAFLTELDDLIGESVLALFPEDYGFVVTEVVVPGLIELGFRRRLPQACPYPSHRGSDWVGDGERRICGICHPPARLPLPSSGGSPREPVSTARDAPTKGEQRAV
jgi:hypothetical protein